MKKLSMISLALFIGFNSNAFSSNTPNLSEKGYELKEVVVLSRHNIRAPLSGKDSILGKATTHQWIDWSANPSELTSRGGILESIMGQYFRKWLEDQGLVKESACLNRDELNIYANSMQRTIATAEYFKSGFSPTCGIEVSHRFSPSKMDPIFFPRLTKLTPEFQKQALKEIDEIVGKGSLKTLTESLKPSFELIEKVIDMSNSTACKEEKICKLDDFNTQMIFKLGNEPNLSGSLKLATRIADALVLQYFEEPNDKIAGFGHTLSTSDWENISKVKDVYGDVLFTAPIVAANVAHPLLVYLHDELNAKERKFTYLVGHDSNIGSVTSALGVEDYSLPNTIEKKTPIGSKLLFEKWVNKETKTEHIALNIMYQTTEQLRNISLLDLKNPPAIYPLKLSGLQPNKDGLYEFSEVNSRFKEAFSKYESIK